MARSEKKRDQIGVTLAAPPDHARPVAKAETALVEGAWETIARFAAAIAGAITLHLGFTYWVNGNIHLHPEVLALDFAIYMLAFALLWLALADTSKWRNLTGVLVLTVALITTVTSTYVSTLGMRQGYGTDVIAFEHYASTLVLRGVDPYTVSMRPAIQQFHVPPKYQTLTWDGRIVDRLSWPAGSFLVFVPFVVLGISDLRWAVLLFHLAVIGVLFVASPRHLRSLVLLPILGSAELATFSGAGAVDFPWVLPLLFVIICLERPTLAGLFFGAACAMKQEPWFLGPFLLVYFLRADRASAIRHRLGNAIRFGTSAAVVFLAVNGPFILHDPRNWALGSLEPALGNLIPIGLGPSALTQLGAPLPADVYTFAAAAIAALLLLYYILFFERLRDVMWLFPMMITWFMPRSLHNYLVFWIPAVALVLALRAKNWAGSANLWHLSR